MTVTLPCDIAVDENDSEKLKILIQRNIPKIASALVGDLQWYSESAQLNENSFRVKSVEQVTTNRFKMFYDFEWNLFSPCLDLNEVTRREEQVTFNVHAGALHFEVVDNQRPGTADEL